MTKQLPSGLYVVSTEEPRKCSCGRFSVGNGVFLRKSNICPVHDKPPKKPFRQKLRRRHSDEVKAFEPCCVCGKESSDIHLPDEVSPRSAVLLHDADVSPRLPGVQGVLRRWEGEVLPDVRDGGVSHVSVVRLFGHFESFVN